ncbi:MAG: metallophosphoesterase family protein [Promethearchaeota archaeon]
MGPLPWILAGFLLFLLLVSSYILHLRSNHLNGGNVGPYLVKDPGNSRTYRMYFHHKRARTYLLLKKQGAGAKPITVEGNNRGGFVAEFIFKDLHDEQRYAFQIKDCRTSRTVSRGAFTTLYGGNDFHEFSFIAISDVQIQDSIAIFQHWFKNIIKRQDPNLVINCGDAVSKIQDQKFTVFFNLFRGVFSSRPIASVIGNHDHGTDGIVIREKYRLIPNKDDRYWYWFNYGSVYFIMLSTNHLQRESELEIQTQWLEKTLKMVSPRATAVIACFHVPPYGPDYSKENPRAMKQEELLLQEHWIPLFSRYRVKLVITGHKHVYCREIRNGTWFQIAGSFQGVRAYPEVVTDEHVCVNRHAVVRGRVDENHIEICAIDLLGRIFDTYIIPLEKDS